MRQDRDARLSILVQKAQHQLVDQCCLAGAAGAGEPDDTRFWLRRWALATAEPVHGGGGLGLGRWAFSLCILDFGQLMSELDLRGFCARSFRARFAVALTNELHHLIERCAGEKDFVHTFATHHRGILVRDCAAATAEHFNVSRAFLAQKSDNFREKLDVTSVVTGNADRADVFLDRGATCVVNYFTDSQGQNKADAERVAKELKDPLVIDCDVTQPQQVEAMMKQIQDRHGGLDILVNNSGVIRDRTIKKMSLEEFESIVRVNLTGTFNVTQKAMSILRNGGRIVNLSSVSGQMGLFGQANYSSSKAAIIALTKVSARELARQNITVNAIAPGFIDVGMSKGMPDEITENFKKQIPLGRLGDVREIVDAALFLASPMASYITGHVLNVNGGFYMG